MRYEKSLPNAMPTMPQAGNLGDNARTYFAGLKPSALNTPDIPNMGTTKKSNLAGDIIDFIMDNPLVALGGTALLGGGLSLYGRHKKARIPKHDDIKIYTDAIKYSMGGIAGLILGHGVIKRLSQEPIESLVLKNELKNLQKTQKKPNVKDAIPSIEAFKKSLEKPKTDSLSTAYPTDMRDFFAN
jgi:hypothetical protein